MALTKIDDRGLKTPIDLLDNEKIRLGTGNDLEIYHDGTHSRITNATGNLQLQTGTFVVNNAANTENILIATQNGSVDLYYDNVKKFETTSAGVSVTGTFTASSTVNSGGHFKTNSDWNGFYCGASDDLQIYHDGSNSYISDQGTGELRLLADVFHVKNAANDETLILGGQNGAVSLYHDNNKRFETTAGGTIITGTLDTTGTITGGGHIKTGSDSGYFLAGASNDLQIYHNGSNNYINYSNGNLVFKNGTESDANCTQFDSNGDLYVPDNGQIYFGGSADLKIYHDGSHNHIRHSVANQNLYIEGVDDEAGTPYIYLNPRRNQTGLRVKANQGVDLYYDNGLRFQTTSYGTYFNERQIATGGGVKTKTYGGSVTMSANSNHDTLLTENFGNDDMVHIQYAYNWNDGDGGAWGSAIAWNEHDSATCRIRFLGEEISSPGSSVDFILSGNSLSFRFTTGGSGMNGDFMIIAYSKGCDLYTA